MKRRRVLGWVGGLALAAAAGQAQAQGVQIFELQGTVYPASELSESPSAQEMGLQTFKATLSVPVVLSKDKRYLYNKLSFQTLGVDYDEPQPQDVSERIERVYGLKYELTFASELRPRWWLSLIGSLGLASDFKDLSSEDLQTEGYALLTRNVGENLVLGGGVGVSRSSGDPQIVPLLYVRRTTERWKLELVFPDQTSAYYKPNKAWQIGLAARYEGNGYRIDEERKVRASVITAGPSVRWRFSRPLSLSLDTGIAVDRRFDGWLAPAQEDLPDHLETGVFVRAGLQLWVATDKDR